LAGFAVVMGMSAFNRDKNLASHLEWFASVGMGSDTEKKQLDFPQYNRNCFCSVQQRARLFACAWNLCINRTNAQTVRASVAG
jgi:hypothetical protein